MAKMLTCPFCLTDPPSMTVRYDKKARSYLACQLCKHKIFCYTTQGYLAAQFFANWVGDNREVLRKRIAEACARVDPAAVAEVMVSSPTQAVVSKVGAA